MGLSQRGRLGATRAWGPVFPQSMRVHGAVGILNNRLKLKVLKGGRFSMLRGDSAPNACSGSRCYEAEGSRYCVENALSSRCLVESQAWLRAVPVNELANRVVVGARRTG
jgi:hypothetical protein